MTTPTDINGWFPNSGTATPANLRTALIAGRGTEPFMHTFHDATTQAAARTALGATTTGSALFTAASAAAARAAVGAAAAPAALNVRSASHSLAASGVPGHEIFNITAAATLTLPLLADCTIGTQLVVVNFFNSTAPVTIARGGTDTIDARTSLTLYPGESIILAVSSEWRPINEPVGWRRLRRVVTSGLPAQVDIPLPSEFSMFELRFQNLMGSVAAELRLRVSVDGGATYLSGAADYTRAEIENENSTVGAGVANQAFVDIGGGTTDAIASSSAFGSIQIRPGSLSAHPAGMIDVVGRAPAANLKRNISSFLALGTTTRATHIRFFTSAGTLANGCEFVLLGLS